MGQSPKRGSHNCSTRASKGRALLQRVHYNVRVESAQSHAALRALAGKLIRFRVERTESENL